MCPKITGISEVVSNDIFLLKRFSKHHMNIKVTTYCNAFAGSIQNGSLLHSKVQYTTVEYSSQLLEQTYTSDPHSLGTPTRIEFFQQDVLWQSSITRSHSCSIKLPNTSGQSIVGLSVHLHTTTAPRRIIHR
jgi:hypothetical protein